MGIILKMSPKLANMIAAGEVVERPSSVVKELVENAIDANATSITILLKDGGLSEIQVIDDGDGMDESDVNLAFIPHATSKIKTEYDLFRISSLGFRGEAIASIAAVSRMQIISSQDGLGGYQVTYEAGYKKSEGVIHANKGTTIIVSNLFFNTPARLKYLKPAKSELASISYLLDRIALAYPKIRFKLVNDDKVYLATSASNNLVNLMGEVYGLEVAKNILTTGFVIDGIKADLTLVKPEVYRSNKLEITLIINGRFVKNYPITNSVIEGYATYLPISKYPIAIINLNVDPTLVDVNVHPSKTEVKLAIEEEIAFKIKEEIKKTLENSMLIPNRNISNSFVNKNPSYVKENIFDLPRVDLHEEEISYNKVMEKNSIEEEPNSLKEEIPSGEKLPYLEYVGQAFGTYLIFQNNEGLYLVDQHAAAERINYEKYYELLGAKNQPSTELLVPFMLSFTKNEVLFLNDHLNDFADFGFKLEPISDQDYLIREIPLWANHDNIKEITRDIFELLITNKRVDVCYFRDEIAKQISCKGSIKANHALNQVEIKALMTNLNNCKNPYTCPHGRPTIIRFKQSELETMFERIQS